MGMVFVCLFVCLFVVVCFCFLFFMFSGNFETNSNI